MPIPIASRIERSLLYGSNIWYLGEGMFGPLFAVFTERIGGDVLDIVWAWAAFLIVSGSFYIFVGTYVDGRFDKRKVMVLGYALNAAFTFTYLLVATPLGLLLVQVGLGFAGALATPTWNALYSQNEDRRRVVYKWGLADGAASIITGIAVVIGGFIVTTFSFTTLFVVMGVIQSVAAVYQSRIIRMK